MHCNVATRKKRTGTVQEERISEHQNLSFGLRRDAGRTTPDCCITTEPCHLSHLVEVLKANDLLNAKSVFSLDYDILHG